MKSVEWNPETIGQFQNSVHSNDYSAICFNEHVRRTHNTVNIIHLSIII